MPSDQSVPQSDELLTVSDLAVILKCKESSVYNLTRGRGRARSGQPGAGVPSAVRPAIPTVKHCVARIARATRSDVSAQPGNAEDGITNVRLW